MNMKPVETFQHDIAIIGAGPIGLEMAVAFKKAGLDYVHIEGGQIGQTIANFPPHTRFFSSNERIAIAGVPIPDAEQTKCTREHYLAYLRSVAQQFDLQVRTYERVIDMKKRDDAFAIITKSMHKQHRRYDVKRIVLVTGGTAKHRTLGIPGEDLPHVTHDLGEIHQYFDRKVLIVGGKNSAVESALRCYHAGAHVAISYRKAMFPDRVKYWLLPEIVSLIKGGEIAAHFETRPVAILPEHVTLESITDGSQFDVPANHVLTMIGYESDMSLCKMLGVTLNGRLEVPTFNEQTMETDVPDVYVAGTASAGTQEGFRVYIENSHIHVDRIVAALQGKAPPPVPEPYALAES